MAEIDTAREWRRLQELYAGMSEEELEAVAGEAYHLTDVAKQALNAEIAHRNLKLAVRLAPVPKEPEIPQDLNDDFDPSELELTNVGLVESREEAEWVKTTLNQAGMPCYFDGRVRGEHKLVEDLSRLDFAQHPGFGVKVLVIDHGRARHALEGFGAHFGKQYEEVADFDGRCPQCRSTEIVFEGLDSNIEEQEPEDNEETEQTAAEPAGPEPQYHWSCDACGYQWEDDGVEMKS